MDDYRLIITLGGILASLAAAWGFAKNQLKAIIKDMEKLENQHSGESERIDSIYTRITVVENRLAVVTGILQPEKLHQNTKEKATFQAKTEEKLERLLYTTRQIERRMDKLENKNVS